MSRYTHILEVSEPVYNGIRSGIEAAGQDKARYVPDRDRGTLIDMGGLAVAKRPGRLAGMVVASPDPKADPNTAHYHTFQFMESTRRLAEHPPDWYDGTPKECPGSGMPPGVRHSGEVMEDGEPKYLCRCPWCDKPYPPGPMPEHTFIPVRAEDLTFNAGHYLIGIELPMDAAQIRREFGLPQLCDGDHPLPVCAHPQCHLREEAPDSAFTPDGEPRE